jgi:hypothetical protein
MGDTRHQQAVDRAEVMLYQSTLAESAVSLDSTGMDVQAVSDGV